MLDPDDAVERNREGLDDAQARAHREESHAKFQNLWNQNAEKIGRVLFAHLAVEYFLTKFIQWANPRLGSLSGAHLTFGQKIELLGDGDQLLAWLRPGLRTLNVIRSRISHQLSVEIDEDDSATFLDVEVFAAARSAAGHASSGERNDPVSLLEEFSEFAASVLHSCCNPATNVWKDAVWDGAASKHPQ